MGARVHDGLSPERQYRLVLELSQKISRSLDLQQVLEELLRVLRTAIEYDAAGVFVLNRSVPLLGSAEPNLIAGMVQIGFDEPSGDDPMLRSGKGIIGHVVHTGETVLTADVRDDPRYVAGRARTRSELAVPIVSESGVIGCLNVESDREEAFSARHAELLAFFASAAALSIEKALLHRQVLDKQRIEDQLRVAREVQAGLLPAAPPGVSGWSLAGRNLPTWAIGGDYFDYVPLADGRLGLVIADVSGKGIPAALIMATFRAGLRHELRRQADPRSVATELNRALLESRDAARFVTAVCAVLDPSSGDFDYVNCGHNPPLVLRRGGETETLPTGGPALGLFPDVPFGAGRAQLQPGDRLVLYTDGVVEITDPSDAEFGVSRLEARMRSVPAGAPERAIESVVGAARQFSGREPFDDDFTLVVVDRSDPTAAPEQGGPVLRC
jgi:sigma-B regulation protein RsbU (phosphoserine phosphatase)